MNKKILCKLVVNLGRGDLDEIVLSPENWENLEKRIEAMVSMVGSRLACYMLSMARSGETCTKMFCGERTNVVRNKMLRWAKRNFFSLQ